MDEQQDGGPAFPVPVQTATYGGLTADWHGKDQLPPLLHRVLVALVCPLTIGEVHEYAIAFRRADGEWEEQGDVFPTLECCGRRVVAWTELPPWPDAGGGRDYAKEPT